MNTASLHTTADLSDLPGILSAKDQRRAFGKAKRHTYAVKALKYLMPLLSVVIIVLYFIPTKKVSLLPDLPVSIDSLALSGNGLKMINPRYSGSSDKLGSYEVQAEYALQQVSATHIMELHKISGHIKQPDNKWTKLQANKGIYDTKKESMNLSGDILIRTNQGMAARLQSADVNMKKQEIITDEPVLVEMNGNKIEAEAMNLSIARKRVLFTGGVKVKLLRNKSMTK